MKKIICTFLVIIFTVPVLTSCYDYKEPNDYAYIISIGIDKSPQQGIYNYTIQFARPSQISGGSSEEGGSGKDTISIVNTDAPSLYTAINLGNHVISKTFTLSHTKIIVISNEIAKESITPLIDYIGRSSDIRPNVYVCISNGLAKEYLESLNPVIEINPVKYYELIFENPKASYFPKNDAKNLYFNMKSDIRQSLLPLVGKAETNKVEKNSEQSESQSSDSGGEKSETKGQKNSNPIGSDESENTQKRKEIPINKEGFEFNMKEYVAGELDIEKLNPSEAIGAAVFKKDKMIGELSNIECELYNIITGNYKGGYAVFYSKASPKAPITINIEQQQMPIYRINMKNGNPKIEIILTLEGDFTSIPNDYHVEKNISEFETEASYYIKEALLKFLKKTTDEFDSDIVGFGVYAKKFFFTYDEFNNYNWGEKYKDSEFDVKVNFQIRKTGLIIKSDKAKRITD